MSGRKYIQLPVESTSEKVFFTPPTVSAVVDRLFARWQPVDDYKPQPPGTLLLLWEKGNDYADRAVLAEVDNNDEHEDCLVLDGGYILFTSDWEYITHWMIITAPKVTE